MIMIHKGVCPREKYVAPREEALFGASSRGFYLRKRMRWDMMGMVVLSD